MATKENLLNVYQRVASENEGKWFGITRDGELLAIANNDDRLWKKIRKKMRQRDMQKIDMIIGYSQTKKEKETACLLLSASTNTA